jgi:hypothetical protein
VVAVLLVVVRVLVVMPGLAKELGLVDVMVPDFVE